MRFLDIDPRTINAVLAVILAVLTALVVNYAVRGRPGLDEIIKGISKIPLQIEERSIETFKPASYYIEEARKRDIFHPIDKARPGKVELPKLKKAPAERFKEGASDLSLKGISWGRTPKAIIKSKKDEKVYFLRAGQMIGTTGIEIKTILKDKVIISYEDEEMELL